MLARFGTANSFGEAKFLVGLLEEFKSLPKSRLREVEPLLKTNVDLREAHYVPARFAALLRKHGLQPTAA